MKILIFGDIHGRHNWRDILQLVNPDKIIFLGDYVTTHEHYTDAQQREELEAILNLKESRPDDIVLLRGNHDLDGLGYYWAACYPDARDARKWMSQPEFKERFLKLTQWVHVLNVGEEQYICSHAGVSKEWLSKILKMDKFDPDAINALEPSEAFGFNGDRWDNYGTSPTQSCTWIRPSTLAEYAIDGYHQIVGHTGTHGKCICGVLDNGLSLWMCDALQQSSALLVEDNKLTTKIYETNRYS